MRDSIAAYIILDGQQEWTSSIDGRGDGRTPLLSRRQAEDWYDSKPEIWEEVGTKIPETELERLKNSIVEMALSRVEIPDELYVGG